jgi:hypothetical protein
MGRRPAAAVDRIAGWIVVCASAALALGCQSLNEPIYIAAPAKLVGTGADMNGAPSRVKGSVVLRFRQPSAAERKSLDDQGRQLGFDVPWLQRRNIHLELLYTVTNLDPAKTATFQVAVDGANEFTKYDEDAVAQAFVSANQKPVFVALMAPTPRTLGPSQVFQGVLREDDFVEGSLDLDAMGRWSTGAAVAPFPAVLINRSDVNPIGLDKVPANVVIPAMQEVDVTLVSDTPMQVEFMVRVRDDNDQLLHESGDRLFAPTPAVFMPTIATI